MVGRAVKIIDVDSKGKSFVLKEKALKQVLSSVPDDMDIAVVSVVGAFRTGKSFLLDLFLRYLKNTSRRPDAKLHKEPKENWMFKNGSLLEGNKNDVKQRNGSNGFSWRSGRQRCTTGIWLWTEYFVRILPETGDEVAVLLMDTQGMFDSTLGQHLTASIFGLSTLISSYTIYNLDKRIQEDQLQHLALFSEYGRVAMVEGGRRSEENKSKLKNKAKNPRPFQRVELLVRDYAFEDLNLGLEDLLDDMDDYLESVLRERQQRDLKEVRDQIKLCFEEISCYCLPHPGLEIEGKRFNGDLKVLRPEFRRLVSDYCRRVFSTRLMPKKVNGKSVTASQLFNFAKAYCALFKEAKIFPKARTLLAATSDANNLGAIVKATQAYRSKMDRVAGPGHPFIPDKKLKAYHDKAFQHAVMVFQTIATIGPKQGIEKSEKKLVKELKSRYADYREANHLRDPYGFVNKYFVPLIILGIASLVGSLNCNNESYLCRTTDLLLYLGYYGCVAFLASEFMKTKNALKEFNEASFADDW